MAYTNFPKNKPFKKLLGLLYTCWLVLWFVLIYLFLFPLQWWFLQKEETKAKAHALNRLWAKILFPVIGMPVQVQYDYKPDPNGCYVFVSNHFSYWDIASMGLIINNFYAFIGKMSVKGIPMVGYMFLKLHIAVDRSEKESRAKSMARMYKTLQNGRSTMVFAEGGILTNNPPIMASPLKDGAFQMAIQMQKPIVPVTLYNNHQIIWHDDMLFWPKKLRARVHQPINTKGKTMDDLEELKQEVHQIIQQDLLQYHQ